MKREENFSPRTSRIIANSSPLLKTLGYDVTDILSLIDECEHNEGRIVERITDLVLSGRQAEPHWWKPARERQKEREPSTQKIKTAASAKKTDKSRGLVNENAKELLRGTHPKEPAERIGLPPPQADNFLHPLDPLGGVVVPRPKPRTRAPRGGNNRNKVKREDGQARPDSQRPIAASEGEANLTIEAEANLTIQATSSSCVHLSCKPASNSKERSSRSNDALEDSEMSAPPAGNELSLGGQKVREGRTEESCAKDNIPPMDPHRSVPKRDSIPEHDEAPSPKPPVVFGENIGLFERGYSEGFTSRWRFGGEVRNNQFPAPAFENTLPRAGRSDWHPSLESTARNGQKFYQSGMYYDDHVSLGNGNLGTFVGNKFAAAPRTVVPTAVDILSSYVHRLSTDYAYPPSNYYRPPDNINCLSNNQEFQYHLSPPRPTGLIPYNAEERSYTDEIAHVDDPPPFHTLPLSFASTRPAFLTHFPRSEFNESQSPQSYRDNGVYPDAIPVPGFNLGSDRIFDYR